MFGNQPDPFEEMLTEAESLFNNSLVQNTMFSNIRIDVTEEDDQYTVTADIPGYDSSEIEVQIDGDILTIETTKQETQEATESEYYIHERQNKEKRAVRLPSTVSNPEDISARYENGVLHIKIPKETDESDAVTINIESK